VVRYFREGKGEYLSLSGDPARLTQPSIERQALAQLRGFEAEFCFPFAWQDEPFGFLLAGRKISGDPFTATDLRLLIALAKNMSVVVNQIRLNTQVQHAQELELLGRMSRGMAHDLNNLLTPISTLLQLTEETGELNDELLPVASRNVSTMRAYIKEALFFSENLRPDLQSVNLDRVVRAAVEVAINSRQKPVRVTPQLPDDLRAEVDSVLVQRLIANLISNAIDASPPGGEVTVTLERTARIDEQREWLRLRIIDKGEGISRENLTRIFTPYFTTKDRGDQTRGFGLGLAICRKIATLHGGSLSIASQLKKGTTVQLDLPSRQARASTPALQVQTAA
jgi:signal transduction histidine kinase